MPLFQIAASEKLKDLSGKDNIQCSIKYQVLSDLTAMVGVVKQKKKATGVSAEEQKALDAREAALARLEARSKKAFGVM